MAKPLLVASDVHLGPGAPGGVGRDLARVLQREPAHHLVLAGDIFDLSWTTHGFLAPERGLTEILGAEPELKAALRAQLMRGDPVTLVLGNHDAGASGVASRAALLSALELSSDAPFALEPWFLRAGPIHIEHGHLYDPDNAPAHPLSGWTPQTEPLGIAFTRRFLMASGALEFAHAHGTTPARALASTFLRHKARAPAIIAKYFDTAVGVCVEALHPRDFEQERALGEAREAAQSQRTGLSEELIRAIVEAAPTPTHHRFSSTFMRLYFDRILAAAAGTLGVAALAPFSRGGAASVAALSWAYLAYSSCSAGSRYADLPPLRLRDAALDLAKLTKASLVVFGHTHEEDESGPYINLGSFAFSRLDARPYLVIYSNGSHRPAVTRRLLRIAR